MSYISTLKLMSCILSRKLDPTKLLTTVDKTRIINTLRSTEEGIPDPFMSTDEAIEEKNFSKMLPSDKNIMQDIFTEIKENDHKFSYLLNRLLLLKEKYPEVPIIYNYISLLHEVNNNKIEQYNVIKDTVNKFPNYLFGKISLCGYYIKNDMHNKIPKALNNKLNIYEHYPKNKKNFHVSEVRGFYSVLGSYYIKENKIENSYYCYFILCDIDPEHEVAKKLANEIVLKEIQKIKNKFDK